MDGLSSMPFSPRSVYQWLYPTWSAILKLVFGWGLPPAAHSLHTLRAETQTDLRQELSKVDVLTSFGQASRERS